MKSITIKDNLKTKSLWSSVLKYATLVVVGLIVLVPFAWMISTSLKSEAEALYVPPLLVPSTPQFSNYTSALTMAPFLRYFLNTLIVAACVIVGSTIVTVLAAYAFAWMDFPGRDILFFFILGSMMIPQEMLIITNFMTIANLGWMNSYQALIFPYLVNAFNIFLLRQNMMQIPRDLFTAARIDGLSHFRFLRKVVIPITKPTILTSLILSMIWVWNIFAWPNLVTTKDSLRLVSNGLTNSFTTSTGQIQYELQMAAATMVTLPLIALFLCLRKQIFSGMKIGGIKG
ncbi:MAG: carbohydrate ABC transporter permease [Sphaerochaetaceae bacterium]|nr:carbohydrate ABC transporter permease [Sphaerochaetaceae bacterium]